MLVVIHTHICIKLIIFWYSIYHYTDFLVR